MSTVGVGNHVHDFRDQHRVMVIARILRRPNQAPEFIVHVPFGEARVGAEEAVYLTAALDHYAAIAGGTATGQQQRPAVLAAAAVGDGGEIVGVVVDVSRDNRGMFHDILVQPSVNFSKLEEVQVEIKEDGSAH